MPLIKRLSLHYALQGLGQGLFICVITLFMVEKGFELWQLGVSFGAFGLTAAILELPLGATSDLFGRIKVYRWSLIANCIAFFLAAFITNFWLMLMPMMMLGFGRALETGSVSAWQIEQFNKLGLQQQLNTLLGRLQAVNALAIAIGALIGGYLPSLVYNVIPFIAPTAKNLIAASMVCLLHISLLPWLFSEGDPVQQITKNSTVNAQIQVAIKHGYQNKTIRSILLVGFVFGLMLANLEAYWQPFVSSISLSEGYAIFGWITTGYFLAAAVGPMIYTFTFTKIRIPEQWVITVIVVLLAPLLYFLATSQSVGQFALFYFTFMGVLVCINVPVQVLLNTHTEDSIRSTMQSVLSLALQAGSVLSAIAIAPFIQWLGIGQVWQLLAGGLFIFAMTRVFLNLEQI